MTSSAAASTESVGWKPVGDRLRTRWAKELDSTAPWPEYPRPQLVRENWMSLNGLWDYAIVAKDASCPDMSGSGKILVPFCVESALSGVGRVVSAEEALWYSKEFEVPKGWSGRTILHFGAVDWHAKVWLNEKLVGEHKGGYTAFSMDLSPFVVPGKQRLVVQVLDGTDNDLQPRGKQVMKPDGIWYTPVTGIWQSVWLEPVPEEAIQRYVVTPEPDGWSFTVLADGGDEAVVSVLEGGVGYGTELPAGKLVAKASAKPGTKMTLKVDGDIHKWSPESPYIYAVEVALKKGGAVVDTVKGYTAYRTCLEVKDSKGRKRMGLNGKPYFQFGPLDQGWWPDGLYTAPTDEALRYDIEQTKTLGYNMIRKHIKVEPERWYTWCDRMGVVVWQDMPSVADNKRGHWEEWKWDSQPERDYPLCDAARENYYREWGEIIDQLYNHPSIVVWVPFNEAWGQFQTAAAVDFTRNRDTSRLINSASGGNSFPVGDILDSHNYPEPTMKFKSDGLLIDVLGEYGGIGWAVEGHLWQPDRNWGYIQYKSSEEVLKQYRIYADMLKKTIADGVSAAVYTQTTDVEIEVNGLMTYDREIIKMDAIQLREINLSVITSAPL